MNDAADRRNATRIDAALNAAKTTTDDPQFRTFMQGLFARAIPEDLAQYTSEQLVELAKRAFDHFRDRRLGTHTIAISDPGISIAGSDETPQQITSIDIINDNMPFLVDSVMGQLQERGFNVRLVLHPIFAVERDDAGTFSGKLQEAAGAGATLAGRRESVMHVDVDAIASETTRTELKADLDRVLDAVRVTVSDWQEMRQHLRDAIERFQANPPPVPVDELAEAINFLKWLADDNFTLIGMRQYRFDVTVPENRPEMVDGTGLGILRDPELKILRRGRELVSFTPEIREFLMRPVPLIVTKANVRSLVHRRTHLDYIGVKLFAADGTVEGELRIVGLFTSTAYTRSVRSIPYLRRKVDHVLRATGFDPAGHSGKVVVNVLETYPRDELFQIDVETLTRFVLAIMQLDEHPRLRVLPRVDRFDRFVSVLVYVPRDRFSTETRLRIGEHLAKVYDGRISAFYPTFLEGAMVRVHFIVGRYEGVTPQIDQAKLESEIASIVRNWHDNLRDELARALSGDDARDLQQRYQHAFSVAYREAFGAAEALSDIRIIDELTMDTPLAVNFTRRDGEPETAITLKLYHVGAPIALSDRVPVLENMGFRVVSERTYMLRPASGDTIHLHDMVLGSETGEPIDLARLEPLLEDCYKAIAQNLAEDDGFNALVLRAGLAWRDVAMLRAYARYARQIRVPFSQDYLWSTLNRHAHIAALLVDLFHARFNPAAPADEAVRDDIAARIETALQDVDSLDEDRIIRRFVNLIRATKRTNFFQRSADGTFRPAMAFKFACKEIDALPLPRPMAEISVYSPRVEGVHLRFGKVARGGLRWSDRPQDFRTEVLGLVKAQQVKNAVIVPVGAKGGFVPKHLPVSGSRDDIQTEGIASYKIFINSLLDVTDNLDLADVIPPPDVVRHDGDDPYLVVAADKGTATFSDTANSISQARGFWLDDAFASGGSAGYDHKKMGITARGGWEAVKRHFREMDIDIQSTPFSVVGVGDMSGDVFGNGMLLSQQIRLLAAFDHRDIFIDPDPDPAISFAERVRLFALPRSSWADYDKSLISKGGGVFSRRDKSILLSPEMRKLTGLSGDHATPFDIMSAILKADADLLWFGGIGTYVRAASESDESAGDRANDAIRVAARDLRVKVIGEGANLGVTQLGRIEFAQAGGRVNTDAIDNSAGVNSSDMEVNIKIALGQVVRTGTLDTTGRNELLAAMTDEVAALVLRNNYLQTLALSLMQQRGASDFPFQLRFMRDLEQQGLLDRSVELLPDDAAIDERLKQGKAFTRPELAVLLAYAKIVLYDELLASTVPDDDYLSKELVRYFPSALVERYGDAVQTHRLRREIISTMLANSMINRGGAAFVSRLVDQTGANVSRIAAAFAIVRDSFSMTELNGQIDALDNKIGGALQLELYQRVQDVLLDQMIWFLRNVNVNKGLAGIIARYRDGIETQYSALSAILPREAARRLSDARGALARQGLPQALADRIAALELLTTAPDIVLVAQGTGRSVADVARVFFAISAYLETDRIKQAARELQPSDYFDRLALTGALENLADAQRQLTAQALATEKQGAEALAQWSQGRTGELDRTRKALAEIAGEGGLTVSKLSVGASLVRDLVRE